MFSILIPSWNNLGFLKLCIESIEKNSAYKHEILIHVNDGSDGTLEWVRQKGYKHTHSEENIGVCYALNGLRPLATTDNVYERRYVRLSGMGHSSRRGDQAHRT